MSQPSSQNLPVIQKVEEIIDHIRQGKMVIMVDDHKRENEGDLVMAAEDVTAESINFMAKEARGLICLPMEESFINRLKLPMMSDHSKTEDSRHTAFTVSIEAREGVSTGISAKDRATTIQRAIDVNVTPDDIVVPGHVFPLKARPGGVLTRAGHTEGSVDLAKLAGKKATAVICEIMNDDGTMARREDLRRFSQRHNIPMISIEELITYRLLYDSLIQETRREPAETPYGIFQAVWFESTLDYSQHVALVKGTPTPKEVCEVRVYRQRFFDDVFGAAQKSSHHLKRVEYGLEMLASCETGVYLYLSARPGLRNAPTHLSAPALKPIMDPRLYGIGAQILRKLGVGKLILNTLAPRKLAALGGFGLEMVGVRVLGKNKKTQELLKSTPPLESTPPLQELSPPIKKRPSMEHPAQNSHSKDTQTLPQFLIIASRWHSEVVESLVEHAEKTLVGAGVAAELIQKWWVPGAYELIAATTQACHTKKATMILCFGCIIKGETAHNQLIAEAINQSFVELQTTTSVPIIHGVLVADNIELAYQRCGKGQDPSKNRGKEAAETALKLAESLSQGPQPLS